MRILILIIFSALTVFGQYGNNKTSGYGGQGFGGSGTGQRFSAVDLDATSEYMYRNAAAADSFLQFNGYDRVQLPQSTMKVNFDSTLSAQAFATDSGMYRALYTTTSLVGGKYRFTLAGSTEDSSGIEWNASGTGTKKVLQAGKLYYVQFKMRWVSGGTPLTFYAGQSVMSGKSFSVTPSSEERYFQGTFLCDSSNTTFKIYTITEANASIYEIDDIEIKLVTNSVSNGTFTGSTTGWALINTYNIGDGIYYGDATTYGYLVTTNAGQIVSGKRYALTFQLTGNNASIQFDNSSAIIYISNAVYNVGVNTVYFTSTANANSNLSFTFYASGTAGPCTVDNIHLYEVPSYRGVGNHSVTWSKVDALPNSSSDTTSLQIISTGAGNATGTGGSNVYIVSGANTYHSMTSGNKYTLEIWARSEVTGCSLSVHAQGQTKTVAIGNTPGTFTKLVFNFESISTVADSIRIFVNQADTLYVDSVNFSQSFDFTYSGWVYPNNASGDRPVMWNKYVSNNAAKGYGYYINNATVTANISDSINSTSSVTGTVSQNQWNFITLSADRIGYCSLYVNGVYASRYDISGIGSFKNRPFNLGWDNASGRFSGLIGEHRVTRFSNISSSTWATTTPLTMYTAYTRGNGFQDNITGGGKKISLWFDWSVYNTDANFLMDLSGNGYNLVGSGVTTADHTFWKR